MSKITFDLNKQVTQDLPVKPIKEYGDNVVGQITNIEIIEKVSEAKNDGYQYKGFTVPSLVITFKQSIDTFNEKDRYAKLILNPVVTKMNTGADMDTKTVDNIVQGIFGHLKHILDTFEGTSNFKPLKKLTALEQSTDAQTMLDNFDKFYKEWLVAFAGKDGNGVYNGVDLTCKFIVNTGERKIDFPKYLNKGYLAVAKMDNKGRLTNPVEFFGESIVIPEAVSMAAGATAAPTAAVDLDELDL